MSQKENAANKSSKGIDVGPSAWRPNYQLKKTVSLKIDGKGTIRYKTVIDYYYVSGLIFGELNYNIK